MTSPPASPRALRANFSAVAFALWSACWMSACVNSGEVCRPGQQTSCVCDASRGVRACSNEGQWAECACPTVPPTPVEMDSGVCFCPFGCCGATACRLGNTREACGADRELCTSCGVGEQCVGRRCVTAPSIGLSLVVVSASVPTFDPSKRGWCLGWDCLDPTGTAPDVFVRESGGGFRTVTAWNLFTPEWNEVVATGLTAERLAEPIVLDVLDDDRNSAQVFDEPLVEDAIARFEIRLRPEQRVPGRLVFTSGASASSLVTLTLELR